MTRRYLLPSCFVIDCAITKTLLFVAEARIFVLARQVCPDSYGVFLNTLPYSFPASSIFGNSLYPDCPAFYENQQSYQTLLTAPEQISFYRPHRSSWESCWRSEV